VKVDGTGLRQVTKTSAYETQGAFSPDGTKITFTRQPAKADIVQSAVYKMRADGTNVVRLTTPSRLPITKATDPFWNNLVKP
jgi:Tol biopolymer transport system component